MPQLSGPTDPAADARWPDVKPRKGFFTDTSICIGCKACEVACKEWNRNPRDCGSFPCSNRVGPAAWDELRSSDGGAPCAKPEP
jgi:Fe-S-cluster-containing dehydrogenase component